MCRPVGWGALPSGPGWRPVLKSPVRQPRAAGPSCRNETTWAFLPFFSAPSFGEGDLLDQATAFETAEICTESRIAADGDGRCDQDGVVGGELTASGESEIRGREVERSLEVEAAATRNDVRTLARFRGDRPVLEEEHSLHRSARGGGEKAEGATGDTHGPIAVAGARGVVESHARALDRALSAHRQPASVEDVDAGLERHHGAAGDGYAAAVDAGVESRPAVYLHGGAGRSKVAARELRSCALGERVRLRRNAGPAPEWVRAVAGTAVAPGDGDRCAEDRPGPGVQRAGGARVHDDAARGAQRAAASVSGETRSSRAQGVDAARRILEAGDRARAHPRALEAEHAHEYRWAALGDNRLDVLGVARVVAADGRVVLR